MSELHGLKNVKTNLKYYRTKFKNKAEDVLDYTITQAESEAKRSAPWTDRTGNARRSITGVMLPATTDVISAALFIGMSYGVNLELSYQGRYRIIWPTITQARTSLLRNLKGLSNIRI